MRKSPSQNPSTQWGGSAGVALSLSIAALLTGCGANSSHAGPIQGEVTSVTLLASSTANDKISEFNLMLNTIALTNASGKSVSLLTAPQQVEFTHLNATAEPIAAGTIPQDSYVSASITVGSENVDCVAYNTDQHVFDLHIFSYGYTPNSFVTVNLPAPIAVSGSNMVLLLDLDVLKSAAFNSCIEQEGQPDPFTISPTFNLTAVTAVSQSTSPDNGKMTGLDGIVSSMDPSSGTFVVTGADGAGWDVSSSGNYVYSKNLVWSFSADSHTAWQRVSGLSTLTAGMPVEVDTQVQPDGSLLATRVEVPDTNTTSLTLFRGLVTEVVSLEPDFVGLTQLQEGLFGGIPYPTNPPGPIYTMNDAAYSFENATFQISWSLTNLDSLPFTPSFTAQDLVAGQSILFTSHATAVQAGPVYVPASTVTLLPQVINGTVQSISTEKGFTVYTIALAPYDLFPQLAFTDAYQKSPLTDPSTVVVYADANTQMLNSSTATAGSLLRFNGLVFNDHGTLRMDCNQILDGVTE